MGTLGDLVTRIQSEIAHTDTVAVKNAIFSAIAHYANTRFWFNEGVASFTAVSLTAQFDLSASDLIEIDELHVTLNGTNYRLAPSTWDEIEDQDTGSTANIPTNWCIHHQMLRLYPTPSGTLSAIEATGLVNITLTASDSASCVWTTEAADLIRAQAKALIYADFLLDDQRAATQQGIAGAMLKRLLDKTVQRGAIGNIKPFL